MEMNESAEMLPESVTKKHAAQVVISHEEINQEFLNIEVSDSEMSKIGDAEEEESEGPQVNRKLYENVRVIRKELFRMRCLSL